MPRTNEHGKPIRRVLEWLLNRDLTDAEMAATIGIPAANYSRRKDLDDFPNFEELTKLGEHFGVDPTMLHITFGLLDIKALHILDENGMNQYVEQGGGDVPQLPPLAWGARENGEKRPRVSPRAH